MLPGQADRPVSSGELSRALYCTRPTWGNSDFGITENLSSMRADELAVRRFLRLVRSEGRRTAQHHHRCREYGANHRMRRTARGHCKSPGSFTMGAAGHSGGFAVRSPAAALANPTSVRRRVPRKPNLRAACRQGGFHVSIAFAKGRAHARRPTSKRHCRRRHTSRNTGARPLHVVGIALAPQPQNPSAGATVAARRFGLHMCALPTSRAGCRRALSNPVMGRSARDGLP